ncbi:MAG: ribosomal rRNA E-loop binding protein Ctc/L25/TL5, large subunit ribosomal protein [Parcubacteria group bacterium]|nr:ribosomal rRNA E-loop binding protein Ctc/L25/TL5, large subunit ribosomal protein [Parcubacteria group bacterium]
MTITLNATKRTETGRQAKRLLAQDVLPAVVYGPKHEAESISLSLPEFKKLLREGGSSSVVEIAGLGTPFQVLIHAIDRDPMLDTPRHVDLYAIQKGAKVNVAVPLTFVGESAAVKAGANLIKVLHELEVESDPSKLPHDLEVDISGLNEIGDQIHVKDIKLPAGVTTALEAEEVVALIQAPAEEEEETAGPDMDAIEVEQKGKGESEDEPEAEAPAAE